VNFKRQYLAAISRYPRLNTLILLAEITLIALLGTGALMEAMMA